jgi:hypothetical protein
VATPFFRVPSWDRRASPVRWRTYGPKVHPEMHYSAHDAFLAARHTMHVDTRNALLESISTLTGQRFARCFALPDPERVSGPSWR